MKYVMMILLLPMWNEMYAQNMSTAWAKSYSGMNQEVGKCITTDKYSNVYTAGYFTGTIDLDPGTAALNINSHGMQDIFISKISSQGNFIWGKRIGGLGNDMVYSIASDTFGSLYITGFFHNSIDADPGAGTSFLYSMSSSSQDIFIIKLDSNASFIWAKSIGGTAYFDSTGNSYDAICTSYSMACDKNSNIYLTGSFLGSVDFDPGPGSQWRSALSVRNIFISKLNSSGNLLWVKTIGENKQGDEAYSLSVDTSGKCCISGVFADTMDFDPGPAVYNMTSQAYNAAFILALNSNGEFCWAQSISGLNASDQTTALNVTIDQSNNIYCAGIFKGQCEYDSSLYTGTLISQGSYDVFILKINTFGNISWAKSFGGINADYCYSLRVDLFSRIFISGSFKGSMDADPGTAVFTLNSAMGNSSDIFISAFNSNSEFIQACRIGGADNDLANAMTVDSSNNILITGYYSNTVDFDPEITVQALSAYGGFDAFVLKLNYTGMILPVELIDFRGIEVDAGNLLKWQTSSELNNAMFELQKSTDAILFSNIACIETMESSSFIREYMFLDTQKRNQTNFYRLKSIDIDGQYSYSNIVCIQQTSSQPGLIAYPNPCKGVLSLISKRELKNAVIFIKNQEGKIVYEKRNMIGNRIRCDLSSQCSGVYYVELFDQVTISNQPDLCQKIKIELIR